MPRSIRSSTNTKDAPYQPPFLMRAGGMDEAASSALRIITPSKPPTNSNMEKDAVDEKGFPPVAIGDGGDDPMESLVVEPDHDFDNPAAVAVGKGEVNVDDMIGVNSGDDDGVETGAGLGTSTGGVQGDRVGSTLNDNVNDSNKSLPVQVLKGGCRDARNHSDEDVMIVNDAETEAEANK